MELIDVVLGARGFRLEKSHRRVDSVAWLRAFEVNASVAAGRYIADGGTSNPYTGDKGRSNI
jgi:hypothetical protein